ncbi:MAG TPA: hypothetical protein VFY12_04310, partial [Arenimonas sp.]|nr:hypothetical protein [Arenimonas sp.]
VLSIGDMNVAMASVTEAQDLVPDAFSFAEQREVDRNTVVVSEEVTVAGINDAAPISVSGGSYAIDGYNFVTTPGTVRAGQTVRVRHSSAGDFATTVSTQLNIGGVVGEFASTTEARDSTPSQFLFTDQTGVATGVEVTSAALGIVDINVPTPISVVGGSYSINSGPFTTAPGTVVWLDEIRVRHTAAADAHSTVDTVLTVGGVSDTFSSTTGSTDTTPMAYTFVDVSGAKRNRYIYSSPVTVSGINATTPISVSGGSARYSINGGSYTSAAGTVRAGDQVRLEMRSSSASYSTVSTTVTIGGISDSWSVRTGR